MRILELTYNEFFNEYKKISKILIKKGFKQKDKVSIIFFNESAFLKVYFAALSLRNGSYPYKSRSFLLMKLTTS